MTLKLGVGVTQGHREWCYKKPWVWFPIWLL